MPIKNTHQLGFSLIELMVGLAIGLLATLAIMQTVSQFEGQKRTTAGTADTQVNGNIALYTIQRQVQMAGYGLPIFDANPTKNNSPLRCSSSFIDHDGNTTTPARDFFPIAITDGGVGNSDTVTVRYFTSPSGGLPTNGNAVGAGSPIVNVDTSMTCNVDADGNGAVNAADGNIALIVNGTSCWASVVQSLTATSLTLTTNATAATPSSAGTRVTCLGRLSEFIFRVNANQLESNAQPVISEIVNIQAQYGISASSNSNQVTSWVDATAATGFATPTVVNRNRIRAIRLAVVARNGVQERTNVTTAAPVAWPDIAGSPAPAIDLSGTANWRQYRYRVYETIIPLRNMTWSGEWL